MPREALEESCQRLRKMAETYLSMVAKAAGEAGVAYDLVCENSEFPYEAIIRVAEQRGCDLIMMASHGRRGVRAVLIGSEVQKVLTHSTIPVLVYR